MRLLEFRHNKVSLRAFRDDEIPPYAILSHTWGRNEDEVSFQDITADSGGGRRGYNKIEFCAKQAAADNLEFFWVDTCCIKKTDSSELGEAITSMFRWYQNAVKCYVYLPDVSVVASRPWEVAFRESRWFTRGWTLQELIAPRIVEFFSSEGKLLGDKRTLEDLIHKKTDIPIDALRDGANLSKFSDHQRFQWINSRQTQRQEDMVYSLLGIFDVSLVMNYGEGVDNARHRLNEAIKLRNQRPTSFPDIHIDPHEVKKIFEDAWSNFTRLLSPREQHDFSEARLEHIKWAIFSLQREQESKKSLMNCCRLQNFLEGMGILTKLSGSILNVDRYAAYIWGPMKFMLQVSRSG